MARKLTDEEIEGVIARILERKEDYNWWGQHELITIIPTEKETFYEILASVQNYPIRQSLRKEVRFIFVNTLENGFLVFHRREKGDKKKTPDINSVTEETLNLD